LNKLSVRLPALLVLLMVALVGTAWYLSSRTINQGNTEIAALRSQLSELQKKESDLSKRLSAAQAGQEAMGAGARAADAIQAYISKWSGALRDPVMQKGLSNSRIWPAQAAALFAKDSSSTLDHVVIVNSRGAVAAAAPSGAAAGAPGFEPASLKSLLAGRKVRVETRQLPNKVMGLAMACPLYGGPKRAPLGAVAVTATFGNILKDVGNGATPGISTGIIIVDRTGTVLYAPVAELVGQRLADSSERALAEMREGVLAQVSFGLQPWQGVARTVQGVGIQVISLATLGPGIGSAGGDSGNGHPLGSPLMHLIVVAVLATVVAVLVVVGPVKRVRELAAAAQALTQGAGAVEIRSVNAKDEIGDLARAVEKLGEELATERGKRSEGEQAVAGLQKDLAKMQAENRELTEYQKDLETRTRREKETLDSDLTGVRQELETERQTQAELRVSTQAQALAAHAELEQVRAQLNDMQASTALLRIELDNTKEELAKKPAVSSPVADFTLFSEAASALSIELSALLEAVQNYMGLMMAGDAGITDEQQEFLTTVINRSARSQRILGDLRDFSAVKMPAGLTAVPVDMASLLSDVVSTIQQTAEDKGLEMTSDIAANLPQITGDETRLRQVATVIMQNSVRFTPESGKVSVSVQPTADGIEIKVEDSADPFQLTADEVFGSFHTADEEDLQVRGSGLRYPLMKSIVEGHGGTVELSVAPAGGNLVVVRIPTAGTAVTGGAAPMMAASVPDLAAAPASASPKAGETSPTASAVGGPAPAAISATEIFGGTPAPAAEAAPDFDAIFGTAPAAPVPAAPAAEPAAGFDWGALPDAAAGIAPLSAEPPAPAAAPDFSADLGAVPSFGATPASDAPVFSLEGPAPEPFAFDFGASPATPDFNPAPATAPENLADIFGGATSLDSIMASAPGETAPAEPTPDPGLGLWNLDLGASPAPAAPEPPPPPPPAPPAPPGNDAAFGDHEVIQE